MPKLNPNEPVQWWDTALTPKKAGRGDLPKRPASSLRARWHKDNKIAPPDVGVAAMVARKIADRGWTDEEMIAKVVTRRMTVAKASAEFGRTAVRLAQILRKHGYILGWYKPKA